jgi:hydroxymethylpyrimidine pyrophosphatase-like HAD family hydrolase
LDNTLAEHGKAIDAQNVEKLKRLEAMGIKIAICSGKPVHYLSGFMRQVGLDRPILLGENGAVLQVGVELPPKELHILPYSQVAKESLMMIKDKIDKRLPDIWYQPNLVGVSPFPRCEEEFAVLGQLIQENTENLRDVKVYRHIDCYDIIPNVVDKRAGIHFLAQQIQVTPEEIVAVGDGENDYPMFEYAGIALGVKVQDETKVDKNFGGIEEVLDYIDSLNEKENTKETKPGKPESDDWYTLALEDMEEFMESQGVYIRQ